MTNRQLRVFLCHSSKDKTAVRELYKKLRTESWIDPWLDEEKLLPGQDWHMEIEKAVEATDVVVVLLSNQSVSQEGYVQRELKLALDVADEKPEDAIFIIPLRLDDCPAPRRLRGWHYVDYFPADRKDWAVGRLIASLKTRADALGLKFETSAPIAKETPSNKVSNLIHTPSLVQDWSKEWMPSDEVFDSSEFEPKNEVTIHEKKLFSETPKITPLSRSNISQHTGTSDTDGEVIAALTSLGYSVEEAQSALQSIPKDAPDDAYERLRLALGYIK